MTLRVLLQLNASECKEILEKYNAPKEALRRKMFKALCDALENWSSWRLTEADWNKLMTGKMSAVEIALGPIEEVPPRPNDGDTLTVSRAQLRELVDLAYCHASERPNYPQTSTADTLIHKATGLLPP